MRSAVSKTGVKAVIMKSPCIAVTKPSKHFTVDKDKCVNCKKCIKELGCPAIVLENGSVKIEKKSMLRLRSMRSDLPLQGYRRLKHEPDLCFTD